MKAPAWMSEAQARLWSEAAAEVGGEWTAERLADLEQYACKRAIWLEAETDIAQNGAVLILRTDKGEVKGCQASPYVKVGEDARRVMAQLWARLCAGRVFADGPTVEQTRAIVAAIRRSLPAPEVAAAAGVSVSQIRDWMDRGEDGDPACVSLVADVLGVAHG